LINLFVKPEIRLIIKAPIRADVNLSIVKTSLQRSTRVNIAALITNTKRPKVSITAGRVNSFNRPPRSVFTTPKRAATQK
jgi:hypothetical protein